MHNDLDDLIKKVTANANAKGAATQLASGLATLFTACAADSAKVTALATQLSGQASAIGDAVVAGTDAKP